MPIPRLPETHQSRSVSANAFQVKKNNARTAPTWNAPMKKVVVQLTGCANVLSRSKMFIVRSPRQHFCRPLTNLARQTGRFCNSYVIPSRLVPKGYAFKRRRHSCRVPGRLYGRFAHAMAGYENPFGVDVQFPERIKVSRAYQIVFSLAGLRRPCNTLAKPGQS